MRLPAALLLVICILILDRLSKWWILNVFDLPARQDVAVLPFFSLTMVWNRGISLGLFQADSESGTWLLIAVISIIIVVLAVWLYRVREGFLAVAIALVLGGAIGNLIDRFLYDGAVADFVRLHAFGFSFYVFNVADAAITFGVIALLWDALRSPQKRNNTSGRNSLGG